MEENVKNTEETMVEANRGTVKDRNKNSINWNTCKISKTVGMKFKYCSGGGREVRYKTDEHGTELEENGRDNQAIAQAAVDKARVDGPDAEWPREILNFTVKGKTYHFKKA